MPKFLDSLLMYPNVYMRTINVKRYLSETPAYHKFLANKSSELFTDSAHLAQVLRILSLYRYGGFALDLDVIVQKSVDDLGEDFVGEDWSDSINGAALHLNNYGIGMKVSDQFLR